MFNPQQKKSNIASTSHGNPFEYKIIADVHFGYPCAEKIESFKNWRDYTLTGEVNDGNAYHVFSGISGHAGLFANAADVHVLLQLLINQGRHQQDQLISPTLVQSFMTKQGPQGLGWAMSASDAMGDLPLGEMSSQLLAEGVMGHTGFTGTFILILPAKKISLVLLTNVQNLGVNAEGRYNNLKEFRETITKLMFKPT